MKLTHTPRQPSRQPQRLALLMFLCSALHPLAGPTVEWWCSTEDLQFRLSRRPDLNSVNTHSLARPVVRVESSRTGQTILGLGSSLEHSTCYNLSLLPAVRRDQVLTSLLDPVHGIGMSLMRLCIGTPDFTASPWYTYNDLPAGATDPDLQKFSIDRDRDYVLPVLKAARRIQPDLVFFASPWSPPAWMKTNGRLGGGRIDRAHFRPFALYLARFIEAYRDEGIPIHAITLQNEPGYNPDSYPTCAWTAGEQRDFIRDHLGPVLESRKLDTRIWCFDHNFNNIAFPTTILEDPAAARFVDGTAFHHYEGSPDSMQALQRRFPAKHLYFTEGSTFGSDGAARMLSYLEHGARSYNAWVTFIDHRRQPNPGPHPCSLTPIVLQRDTLETDYRGDYFMYGQIMKFVRPGSVRIDSSQGSHVPPHAAFKAPDGSLVLIAANPASRLQHLAVDAGSSAFETTLPPRSVSSFRWTPTP